MEKQYQINNFSVLNQLPKIYNMLHIANLIVFGFVVNQPVFVIMAITSIQKSIPLSPKKFFVNVREKIISRKFPNIQPLLQQ